MPASKKPQRTKGNLKPSSSSQAGQLLAQAGHSPVGFIGFSNQPAYVPASEIFDDVDNNLDADFRLVLRKFSKKDTVTKMKALQEFISLCESKSDDCIKAVVPFWPRIYNKLAIDVDHKVRELSQKALQALALKAGKNLKPHLQSVMGTWMISMCDTYPTVRSAADTAFTSVFAPAKQTAAFRFCKSECAECFLSNITKQTPHSLSDPLTTSEEDMMGKYHRVVSSSLQAMRKLVQSLLSDSADDKDSLEAHLNTLLSSPAFWKHAKSSVSVINGGIICVFSVICHHCPAVSGPFVDKISPLIFSFLDTKDPVIVAAEWEAMLSMINIHHNCWEHVNWQKAVWPKLKTVLESGCGGFAEVIGPCLLPLLSKLPQNNSRLFFDSFRLGLNQENVLNSVSATAALVTAFLECILFCGKNSSQAVNPNSQSIIQGLLHDQILVVIEASLTDSKLSLAKSPLYSRVSAVVSILGKDHSDVEEDFWKELSSFTRQHLLTGMTDSREESGDAASSSRPLSIKSFFQRLSWLVRGLVFEVPTQGDLNRDRVRFKQQEEDHTSNKDFSPQMEKRSMSPSLEKFVSDILVTSFYLATEFQVSAYFQLFKDVSILHIPVEAAKRLNDSNDSLKLELREELKTQLSEVKSQDVDEEIDVKLRGLYSRDESKEAQEFQHFMYTSLLKFLLYEQRRQPTPNLVFTEELIVSSFAFLIYLCEEDAVKFLTSASEAISSSSIMCQYMEHMIRNGTTVPVCATALDGDVTKNKITELATEVGKVEKINDEEAGGIWRMLLLYLLSLEPYTNSNNSNVCVEAIADCCVLSLSICREKKVKLSPSSFHGVMSIAQVLVQNVLVQNPVLFSQLVSNLIHVSLDSTVLPGTALCSSLDSSVKACSFGTLTKELKMLDVARWSTQFDRSTDECKERMEAALLAGFIQTAADWPTENSFLMSEQDNVHSTRPTTFLEYQCKIIKNWVTSHLQTIEEVCSSARVVQILLYAVSFINSNESDEEDSVVTEQGADSVTPSNDEGANVVADQRDDAVTPSNGEGDNVVTEQRELDRQAPKFHYVLDFLLYCHSVDVKEAKEITRDLIVRGIVYDSGFSKDQEETEAAMSLKKFALLCQYNLKVFTMLRKLPSPGNQTGLINDLSYREHMCFNLWTDFLYILDAGRKYNIGTEPEITSIGEEVRDALWNCISPMRQPEIHMLAVNALDCLDSSTADLAMVQCLDGLLRSGRDLHSKTPITKGIQTLRARFIHRFATSMRACEIESMLTDLSVWSSKDILQTFDAAVIELLQYFREPFDDSSLRNVSECIVGFLRLISQCEDLTSKDRAAFFNKISEIVKWLKQNGTHLLTGSDTRQMGNTHLLLYNVYVAQALTDVSVCTLDEYWEFTLCTLVEWIQFLSEVEITQNSSVELQALMASVCRLAHFVARTFATAPILDETTEDKPINHQAVQQKTKTEWEEFFSEGVYSPLLPKFISLATESLKLSNNHVLAWTSVLDSLASAVSLCPHQLLLTHQLPDRLTITDRSNLPDSLKTLLNHTCPLLNARSWKVQVSVFNLLSGVMAEVANHEVKNTESNKDEGEDETSFKLFMSRSPPEALYLVVETDTASLDTVLMTEDVEQEVEMDIGSQEHSVAVGYLLAWGLQLQLFKCASNELRAKYAQFFKSNDCVSHLCDHLFRLMPAHPSPAMLDFQLVLDGTDEMSSSLLGSLAISVYCQCLEVLPALVRTWWVDQNRKSSNFVDKFTTQYISRGLCKKQLTSSDMTTASIEDITIRARPAAREVSAVYEMAEVTVNMTIKLPENYPLGKVDVSCDKRVGVSQAQWDKWLLQLNIFLQHQNGSIVEGLTLWKGNIDKKFEGIDDCMICFSVIHGTTFQLPRLTCRTCKKKFHSSCLYKWFNTSQKSSCPLCRNLF